ncbi:retrovirus-related pol polyprotein from transposon TNT 1-94, partial [Tanacetum coccineum]
DPTLFTRKAGNDLLLVQIYVGDIIFASTLKLPFVMEFANQMTISQDVNEGQISFLFLGLQISQSPRGIFINQSKYASKIVKKYGLNSTDSVDTPMIKNKKLDEDLQGKQVHATLYHVMIGSLMYLIASRPDLNYAICLCARSLEDWEVSSLRFIVAGYRNEEGTLVGDSFSLDFQDSPDDEEDTRISHEYLNDLEEEYQAKALLAKSKRFFKKGTQRFSSAKATDQTKCHKCGKKAPSLFSNKNEGLIAVSYDWDEEEVHTLLEMEDNDDRKSFLDYLCIDLNYVEEQRNNLSSKYRDLVQELNACKEQLLVLKQAKLNLLTMQHVNTEILKENQNLRLELKELTSITETWLNSSNKVNQCINEKIPTQKKKILGIGQLIEDTSSHGSKDMVFIKSSANNSDMSITSSNLHKSSEAEDSTLTNHDTDEKLDGVELGSGPKTIKSILKSKSTFKAETLKGITLNEPSSAPARGNKSSSASKTNSALAGKLKNVKVEDDPPLAMVPLNALQNKYKTQFKINCELCGQNNHLSENCYEVLFCKNFKRTNHRTCDHAEFMSSIHTNQHHTGQGESSSRSRPSRPSVSFPSCIHCGYNNHHSNDCLYYPTCEICGSYDHKTHDHNKIISQRRGINPRNPQNVKKNYETCGSNVHTTSDHNGIEWFRKRETPHAKKAESSNAFRSKTLIQFVHYFLK